MPADEADILTCRDIDEPRRSKAATETPMEWRRHGWKGVRRNTVGGEAKQRETGSKQKTEKKGGRENTGRG